MPRVREIDEPGDDPILKEIWTKEQEAFGFVLNVTRVQAHTPVILKAAKQLSAAVERSGLLPRQHFSEAQLVELAAAVALENFRSKFNTAFGVEPQGFCVLR
jgi:alkylhydroperoxidase family enzyme